jgi:hypothetical protein
MPYMLNGELISVASEPRLDSGTLWVPLRKLGHALGGTVDWEESSGVSILYLNDHVATFQAGAASVNFDGELIDLQAAPYVEEGETWVPVRVFEKAFGYSLVADPQNGIVELTPGA